MVEWIRLKETPEFLGVLDLAKKIYEADNVPERELRVSLKKAILSLEGHFAEVRESDSAFKVLAGSLSRENLVLNGMPVSAVYPLDEVKWKTSSSEKLRQIGKERIEDFLIQYDVI